MVQSASHKYIENFFLSQTIVQLPWPIFPIFFCVFFLSCRVPSSQQVVLLRLNLILLAFLVTAQVLRISCKLGFLFVIHFHTRWDGRAIGWKHLCDKMPKTARPIQTSCIYSKCIQSEQDAKGQKGVIHWDVRHDAKSCKWKQQYIQPYGIRPK